jgi:hypothetical protein
MDTNALLKNFVEIPWEPSDAAVSIDVRANEADAARSDQNMVQWMSYLPEDCVRSMIAMGWDVTT